MIRSYRSNSFCNFYLVLISGIISFRFFIHGSYDLGLQTVLKPDRGLFSILYLIIVPSSYLYYKHLTLQEKAYKPKDLIHFIFIGLLFFMNSIEVIENSFIFYFGTMTNFYLIVLFMIFYLTLTFNLLRRKVWFAKDIHLNKDHFSLVKNWTIYFFIINILCSVMVIASLYTEFQEKTVVSGKTMVIFSLIFWLFTFFKILISPEILFGLPILNKTLLKFNEAQSETKNKETLTNKDSNWILEISIIDNNQDKRLQENIRESIVSYIQEVERLSMEELFFRNYKTTQSDIAENLGVPASHIVYLFKYHSKISFSEFRMNSRIHDAIYLLEEGFLNSETLDSLAHKTGFASYNPFFIAFKKITGYSPQEYMKLKKN